MKKGDSVKVKKGVMSPDYEDLKIEGWQGRITELDNDTVTIELDSITLDGLSKEYIIDSIVEEADYKYICLEIDELELVKPRDNQNDTLIKQKEIKSKFSQDDEEERISEILKSEDISVNRKKQKKYIKYLKNTIQKPCLLTGMQDFEWEEPYLFGGWSQKEYAKLKLTQPSYNDQFELLGFVDEVNVWKGILVKVKRVADNKEFVLPLWDLKVIDDKSPNYLLVSDYSSWMTNYQ